jgi:hypothetical protein
MTEQDNAHIRTFRQEKLMPGETLVGHLEGWIGEKMGQGERIRAQRSVYFDKRTSLLLSQGSLRGGFRDNPTI